jgi:hypothetical protein
VIVCDSHHAALRYWLEASASGRLPEGGVTVIHFDAHPDMSAPPVPIQRAWRARPGALVAAVDIASFQLAAAWVGLVNRVVWLRPSWAFQIPDGEHHFHVGIGPDGRLQTDAPFDYYVLDGNYAPTTQLRDAVDLELRVMPLEAAGREPLDHDPVILDVDLDGFATRSPAADRLRAVGYSDDELARIRGAFARDHLALPEDPAARVKSLQSLLDALDAVANGGGAAKLGGAAELWWLGVPAADLWFLYGLVSDTERGLPVEALLEEGRNLVGLPEHAPAAPEIEATARRLAGLLAAGAVRPALVTVARSANDGYTPSAAWPAIEWRFLQALRSVRPDVEVRYDRGLQPAPHP